jgi:hypothetical protein
VEGKCAQTIKGEIYKVLGDSLMPQFLVELKIAVSNSKNALLPTFP